MPIMTIYAVAESDEVFLDAQSSGESGGDELPPVSFTNRPLALSQRRLPTPRPYSQPLDPRPSVRACAAPPRAGPSNSPRTALQNSSGRQDGPRGPGIDS